jgi:hypothetical protein
MAELPVVPPAEPLTAWLDRPRPSWKHGARGSRSAGPDREPRYQEMSKRMSLLTQAVSRRKTGL